jgi:hypothetical protein
MYICMYVYMYVCMHVCMHACMYVCMYVCMHAFFNISIGMLHYIRLVILHAVYIWCLQLLFLFTLFYFAFVLRSPPC